MSPVMRIGTDVNGRLCAARERISSDHHLFHRIVQNLNGFVAGLGQQQGVHFRLDYHNMVLLLIRSDDSGELWLDTAAVAINAMVKRDVAAGSLIFEHDIADVIGVGFPAM